MKLFDYFSTNRILRARIAGLEALLHTQEEKTYEVRQKHQAATKECQRMALKLQAQQVRMNQLHNAADCLAKHVSGGSEAMRAITHWKSIR